MLHSPNETNGACGLSGYLLETTEVPLGGIVKTQVNHADAAETDDDLSNQNALSMLAANAKIGLGEAKFKFLDTAIDWKAGAVWQRMKPSPRPCYTLDLLAEMRAHDQWIENTGGVLQSSDRAVELKWIVYGSAVPGVFNLGGDLASFLELRERGDRAAIRQYATACLDVQYPRIRNFGLPITLISLVEGHAMGGGFENALASNVVIADRNAVFAFPECNFNLFPGMGAYSVLRRRMPRQAAMEMITSGRTYSAEELFQRGLVHKLCEPGTGIRTIHEFMQQAQRRRNTMLSLQAVEQTIDPVPREELDAVVDIWCDAVLRINDRDIRVMRRYVELQTRQWGRRPYNAPQDDSATRDATFKINPIINGRVNFEAGINAAGLT